MTSKHEGDDIDFHRDDIISMDISADRKTVVTGETGQKPKVCVWNAETGEAVMHFELSAGSRGVSAVSLSPCGRYVACVDLHNDHRVVVYNIQRNKQLLQMNGSTDRIFDLCWSKRPDDLRFATGSLKQVAFWHPADVTKRLKQPGVLGRQVASTYFNCCAFDEEGWLYTGGENGQIQVWADTCQVVKAMKAHSAQITAIEAVGGKIISGGKDKRIAIIEAKGGNFKLEKFIDLSASFPKSVDFFNGNLIVGLRNGSIVEFKGAIAGDATENNLLASHFEGEVWGLVLIENGSKILTCGDDNQFKEYNAADHTFIRAGKISDHKPKNKAKEKTVTASSMSIYPANQQARAIAYSPKHGHVAVSNNMGKVSIRDYKDFDKKICSLKEAQEWSEAIRYSPCEKFLANGTHDNLVYVYSISDDGAYTLYKSFAKHNSFVTALDWSSDSSYIRSQCGAYEKLYFNIADKAHDSAGLTNTKDKEWATTTVKLGWDVQGIHPSGEDGSHVNGVSVSKQAGVCASGDDWGLLNVYSYPVLDNSYEVNSYTGHSEHVTRAAFNEDGTKLWTVGGQDKTLIQWKRK